MEVLSVIETAEAPIAVKCKQMKNVPQKEDKKKKKRKGATAKNQTKEVFSNTLNFISFHLTTILDKSIQFTALLVSIALRVRIEAAAISCNWFKSITRQFIHFVDHFRGETSKKPELAAATTKTSFPS